MTRQYILDETLEKLYMLEYDKLHPDKSVNLTRPYRPSEVFYEMEPDLFKAECRRWIEGQLEQGKLFVDEDGCYYQCSGEDWPNFVVSFDVSARIALTVAAPEPASAIDFAKRSLAENPLIASVLDVVEIHTSEARKESLNG